MMDSISDTTLTTTPSPKRHRRRHSPQFKAEVLAASNEPGASVASVAQRYHVNANLIHKWRRTSEIHDQSTDSDFGFLPLAMPVTAAPDVRVTFVIGDCTIHWPISHIQQAAPGSRSCNRDPH